jgi:hypothetical protein
VLGVWTMMKIVSLSISRVEQNNFLISPAQLKKKILGGLWGRNESPLQALISSDSLVAAEAFIYITTLALRRERPAPAFVHPPVLALNPMTSTVYLISGANRDLGTSLICRVYLTITYLRSGHSGLGLVRVLARRDNVIIFARTRNNLAATDLD